MTADLTLYSTRFDELPTEPMAALTDGLPDVEQTRDGAAHVYSWPGHTMRCTPMPPTELADHLRGFEGFVREQAQGLDLGVLLQRIAATRVVVGVVVEPDHDAIAEELIGRMVGGLEALVFAPFGLLDETGRALLTFDETDADEADEADDDALLREAAPEAIERKARSHAVLEAEGVPINERLPLIETEAEAEIPSIEAIVERAIALTFVAVRGEGLERERVQALVQEWSAQLTPAEQAFLALEEPTAQQRAQFSWRYEALAVLLWALDAGVELGRPDHIVDAGAIASRVQELGPEGMRGWSRRRPAAEILDAADLIYRYHWAVVDARLQRQDPPANLDPGVVYERHYALNWLVGYMDQDWDDISTDT